MNKELTPLEALEIIKNSLAYHKGYTKDVLPTKAKIIDEEDNYELFIIEKELKEKELQDNALKVIKEVICFAKKEPEVQVNDDGDFCGIVSAISMRVQREIENKERELFREWVLKTCFPKELKALEIIKNKKVNVKELKKCDSVGKYNYRIYKEEEKLTQEDFDLLKEVLL